MWFLPARRDVLWCVVPELWTEQLWPEQLWQLLEQLWLFGLWFCLRFVRLWFLLWRFRLRWLVHRVQPGSFFLSPDTGC